MKGSRGVGRPPRLARSGVTYKESDDDDDEFVPNARLPSSDVAARRSSLRNSAVEVEELGIAKGKRTLTLKRARTVEPPVKVGNENVDVHAIPDAALEEKPALSPDHGRQFRQVVASAEGVPDSHRESSAFECLLEAVSGASGDGEEESASKGQHVTVPRTAGPSESRKDQEEEMTSAAYGPELLAAYATFERKLLAVKGVKGEDTEGTGPLRRLAHSSDEESSLANSSVDKGMKETVESERDKKSEQDGMSSADEKKYKRRGERDNKQSSMSSTEGSEGCKNVEEERQESVPCANGKQDSKKSEEEKQDDVSSADEDEEDDEDAEDSWNESSDASDAENKRPVKEKSDVPSAQAKKPSQEIKTFVKKTKVPKKDPGTPGRVLMSAKSTSASPLIPKKRPALWVGSRPFVSPGPLNPSSPTIVAHRRVVGLSRRHRPPPLHPYLLGS